MSGVERETPAVDSPQVVALIRSGCTAANVHLACSFPDCSCEQIPTAVRAAIKEFFVQWYDKIEGKW